MRSTDSSPVAPSSCAAPVPTALDVSFSTTLEWKERQPTSLLAKRKRIPTRTRFIGELIVAYVYFDERCRPDMSAESVGSVTDEKNLPAVDQCYIIPMGFRTRGASMHDKAVFSMWNHVS